MLLYNNISIRSVLAHSHINILIGNSIEPAHRNITHTHIFYEHLITSTCSNVKPEQWARRKSCATVVILFRLQFFAFFSSIYCHQYMLFDVRLILFTFIRRFFVMFDFFYEQRKDFVSKFKEERKKNGNLFKFQTQKGITTLFWLSCFAFYLIAFRGRQ